MPSPWLAIGPWSRGETVFSLSPRPRSSSLQKLEWYVLGGGSSARQWKDILGILRVQGSQLDLAYLRAQAIALQVRDLLEQALQEAGLQ